MVVIAFKEKTYEKLFGHELARHTRITFSPDQIDEALLGFDEAFLLPELWLSRLAPYVRRRRRTRMQGIFVEEFNRFGKILSSALPPFRFNLFVQFKRPNYLISRNAKQWRDWRQSYYRYEITPHQQDALEQIDIASYGRAAVIYASPAFRSSRDLWSHAENETVIENSNIAPAGKLNGHHHYSYVSAGHRGKAHSDAEEILGKPLDETIAFGLEQNEALPLNQHLKKTAGAIYELMESERLDNSLFFSACSALGLYEYNPSSLVDAISVLEAFSDAYEVSCYAMG